MGSYPRKSFSKLKEEISSHTILAIYDPSARTKISADASAYGLGAVRLQKQQDQWCPIAFSSHSLSETEQRYAQIEGVVELSLQKENIQIPNHQFCLKVW